MIMTFFKIGAFTLGGGYAMIPVIEAEVVTKHGWLTREEFLDTVAIAQSCPGVFAINLSTFIGYKMNKTRGAIASAIGTALPSFLIILAIAIFFHQFEDNKVALIAVPTFNLAKSAKIGWSNCWIPLACALAIWAMGVSPITVIIIAAAGGYLYGRYIKGVL